MDIMEGKITVADLYNIMSSPFIVFGSGSVGKRFIEIIRAKGFMNNLIGIGTSYAGKPEAVYDILVQNIEYYDRNLPVLIAIHDSLITEVREILTELQFNKQIWVYPLFCELYYGESIEDNVIVDAEVLLKNRSDLFSHIVFALVIEQELGNNTCGYSLYKKYFCSFSSEKTAMIRLNSFRERITQAMERGFVQNIPISISKDRTLILDGLHRCVLSVYFGNHMLRANLYDVQMEKYYKHSDNQLLTKERMAELFDEKDIRIIKELQMRKFAF